MQLVSPTQSLFLICHQSQMVLVIPWPSFPGGCRLQSDVLASVWSYPPRKKALLQDFSEG